MPARRCSRSATSRSCAIARRATSSRALGHDSTISYLAAMAALVLERDRPAAASQSRRDDGGRDRRAAPRVGLAGADAGDHGRAAWRSAADRISARPTSGPPCGSRSIRAAGEAAVPFTSGILIGIGETRRERIEALLALRELHRALRPSSRKSSSRISAPSPAPAWRSIPSPRSTTICGRSRSRASCSAPEMNIQAPPNLRPGALPQLDRRRHQRLGRRVAGHARPRQSGAAVARSSTRSRARPQRPARCWSSGSRSIRHIAQRGALARSGAANARVLRACDARGLRAHRRVDRRGTAAKPPVDAVHARTASHAGRYPGASGSCRTVGGNG